MQAEGLSEEQKVQRRQELAQDERKYIRLQRKRMSSDDFEALKLIGRGAFGEVCSDASLETCHVELQGIQEPYTEEDPASPCDLSSEGFWKGVCRNIIDGLDMPNGKASQG